MKMTTEMTKAPGATDGSLQRAAPPVAPREQWQQWFDREAKGGDARAQVDHRGNK